MKTFQEENEGRMALEVDDEAIVWPGGSRLKVFLIFFPIQHSSRLKVFLIFGPFSNSTQKKSSHSDGKKGFLLAS